MGGFHNAKAFALGFVAKSLWNDRLKGGIHAQYRDTMSPQTLAIFGANIQHDWRISAGFARVSLDGRFARRETIEISPLGYPGGWFLLSPSIEGFIVASADRLHLKPI